MKGVRSGGKGNNVNDDEGFGGRNWLCGWIGETGEEKTASISLGERGTQSLLIRVSYSTLTADQC